jgi:hypothetical protein
MTWESLALAGLALVVLLLLVALAALRRGTSRRIEAARAEAAELRARLDRLEQERQRPEPPTPAEPPAVRVDQEYRITEVGEPAEEPVRLERAVFADHVLREGVIRLGSLAHGLRRALDAETRNRIRFEMRREVKRARRQRRAEQREAYRDWRARQRDALTDDDLRDSA